MDVLDDKLSENLWQEMQLRGLSQATRRAYSYHIKDYLEYCGRPTASLKKAYLVYLLDRGLDEASVHLASASIDFFARHVLRQMPEQLPLRHIQRLLGHSSLRTTQVYTHVATADLSGIPRLLG